MGYSVFYSDGLLTYRPKSQSASWRVSFNWEGAYVRPYLHGLEVKMPDMIFADADRNIEHRATFNTAFIVGRIERVPQRYLSSLSEEYDVYFELLSDRGDVMLCLVGAKPK